MTKRTRQNQTGITLDELALMVQRGFNEVHEKLDKKADAEAVDRKIEESVGGLRYEMNERFNEVDERFDEVVGEQQAQRRILTSEVVERDRQQETLNDHERRLKTLETKAA